MGDLLMKKILYVSWTSRTLRPYYDPSVRYRCFNFSGELNKRGFVSHVVSQPVFEENISLQANYDIYVFHRPYLTDGLARFLVSKKKQVICIADFDDMIFDVRFAELMPSVKVKGENPARTRSYLSKNYDASSLIDNFTLSTSPLKEHAERMFPRANAVIHHNAIDPGFLGISKIARKSSPLASRFYAFGYFSGTATHDHDLAMIAPILFKYLKESKQKMLLVGPVKLPSILDSVANQIDFHPLVAFHELPFLMAKCKTLLAPLEDTVFTRSKSGLKFFEAVLAGCNVIASPIPDVDRFSSPLLRKCIGLEAWEAAITAGFEVTEIERNEAIQEIEEKVSVANVIKPWIKEFIG